MDFTPVLFVPIAFVVALGVFHLNHLAAKKRRPARPGPPAPVESHLSIANSREQEC